MTDMDDRKGCCSRPGSIGPRLTIIPDPMQTLECWAIGLMAAPSGWPKPFGPGQERVAKRAGLSCTDFTAAHREPISWFFPNKLMSKARLALSGRGDDLRS